MTQYTFHVDIPRPLPQVYDLARQVERQPELIPEYDRCDVVERQGDRLLLDRQTQVGGRTFTWRSWVWFQKDEALHFSQVGGRLDGTRVDWWFAPVGPAATRLTITQTLNIRHPVPGLAWGLERWVFGPKLQSMARRVLQSFRRACERHIPVSSD